MMLNQGRTRRKRRRRTVESSIISVLEGDDNDFDFHSEDDNIKKAMYSKEVSHNIESTMEITCDKNLRRLQAPKQIQRRTSHPSIEKQAQLIHTIKQQQSSAPQSQFLGWPKHEPLSLSQHHSPASVRSTVSPTKRPRTQQNSLQQTSTIGNENQNNLCDDSSIVSSPTPFFKIFTSQSHGLHGTDSANLGDNRARRVTFEKSQTVKSDSTTFNSQCNISNSSFSIDMVIDTKSNFVKNSGDLWCEKFQPTSIVDLCIANKKIQEVSTWIQSSFENGKSAVNRSKGCGNISLSDSARGGKLLILVGSPGIGKSTLISCLSKDMNLNKMEWVESSYSSSVPISNITYKQNQRFFLEQHSPVQSFEHFLKHSGPGFHSLQIETTSINQKRNQHQQMQQSIIVIDELPNLHGYEAETSFRTILSNHTLESTIPTILLYSNVTEGKHHPDDFERLIEPSILYNPALVHIITINKPTKIKYKQCIHRILNQLNTISNPSTTAVVATNQQKKVGKQHHKDKRTAPCSLSISDDIIDDWYEQSTGDVRAAINRLQFELAGDSTLRRNKSTSVGATRSKRPNTNSQSKTTNSTQQDIQLSSFHALGKLLYAKRQKLTTTKETINNTHALQQQKIPPLQFDPEGVVDQCTDMGIDGILQFVQHHSIDFFTDITEVSIAMDHFSDAATFLNPTSSYFRNAKKISNFQSASNASSSGTIFPIGYASSLTSRAVANANRHPTTCTTLRRFTAPGIYEIYRRMHDNRCLYKNKIMQNLASSFVIRDATRFSENYSCAYQVKCSLSDFVIDIAPYSRIIESSHSNDIEEYRDSTYSSMDNEETILKYHQQQSILQDDDIVEDDDDDTLTKDKAKDVDDFVDDDIDWSIVPNY